MAWCSGGSATGGRRRPTGSSTCPRTGAPEDRLLWSPVVESDRVRVFNEHRDRLRGVAYRVLGRVNDVEDVVQDAWLRWSTVPVEEVVDPEAFLVRVTTRLAIDRLRSAQS